MRWILVYLYAEFICRPLQALATAFPGNSQMHSEQLIKIQSGHVGGGRGSGEGHGKLHDERMRIGMIDDKVL